MAATTFDKEIVHLDTRSRYWRRTVAGFVGVEAVRWSRGRLVAEAHLGAANFRLTHLSRQNGRPTDTESEVRWGTGAEVRGSQALVETSAVQLALALALGAEIIPSAPTITYGAPDNRMPLWPIWTAQPYALIGFEVIIR
jgi:hypothetical protein